MSMGEREVVNMENRARQNASEYSFEASVVPAVGK